MRVRHLKLISDYWDREADSYWQLHPEHADGAMHPSWGLHHIHEDVLRLVSDAISPGQLLVELGCGDGHDAIAFAKRGLRVIGVDISRGQLGHALPCEDVCYINASAEKLPLADDTVDIVTSDHGAFDHSALDQLLPEVKRILRPGGLLVVCTYSPLAVACFNRQSGKIDQALHNDYPTRTLRSDGSSLAAEYSYSEWIRALRAHGFAIERLEELRSPPGRVSYFSDLVTNEWSARWPCDIVWVARSVGDEQR